MGKKLKIYLISFKRGVISKNVKQTSKKNYLMNVSLIV